MKTLFLDIETIPADESKREVLAYLYERKLEKKRKKDGGGEGDAATFDAEDFEQFLLSTSFDGAFGRILCIGYAFDDEEPQALFGDEREVLVDSGADICIFDRDIGELIGLPVHKGKKVVFYGVTGAQQSAYIHTIEIEVGGKRLKTRAAFANLPGHAYGIVGQRGFFEFFRVVFDYQKKRVELRDKSQAGRVMRKAA